MQPYFFPYIGYYQLAYLSDQFIFLDDVHFRKKGFIHRNHIAETWHDDPLQRHATPRRFSMPVHKMSQNRLIKDHYYITNFDKFLTLLHQTYKNAPYYDQGIELVEKTLEWNQSEPSSFCVSEVNQRSIQLVFDYLKIPFVSVQSSQLDPNPSLHAQDRILKLCHLSKAQVYINLSGGRALYSIEAFQHNKLHLLFLNCFSSPHEKCSIHQHHLSSLSILDLIMGHSPQEIRTMLDLCCTTLL